MDGMDLVNLSALWFPVQCFSDTIMLGWYDASGINANILTNPFFNKVFYTEPDERSLQKGASLADDYPEGEIGIVVVAKENHLQVVSREFRDACGQINFLPVIWNARLVSDPSKLPKGSTYFHLYCDTKKHGVTGDAYITYEAGSTILWTEKELTGFRWNRPLHVCEP